MKFEFCHPLSNCHALVGSKTTLIVQINKAQLLDKIVIATKLVFYQMVSKLIKFSNGFC